MKYIVRYGIKISYYRRHILIGVPAFRAARNARFGKGLFFRINYRQDLAVQNIRMVAHYIICPEAKHFGFFSSGEICYGDQLWFTGSAAGKPEEDDLIFCENIPGAGGYALYIWKYGLGVAHRNELLIIRYGSYFGEMIFSAVFGGSIFMEVSQKKLLLDGYRILCGFFERFRFKRKHFQGKIRYTQFKGPSLFRSLYTPRCQRVNSERNYLRNLRGYGGFLWRDGLYRLK